MRLNWINPLKKTKMELQIPGLEKIQKQLEELKTMVSVLNPESTGEKYLPKTKMFEQFDLSSSTLRNRETDGSLTPYKIGVRTYYKVSEIHALLEKSAKK